MAVTNRPDAGPEPDPGASGVSAPASTGEDDGLGSLTLFELVGVLVSRWTVVVGFPLIAALAALLTSLVVPSSYTATATFVPESGNQGVNLPGGLAELAWQLGVATPGGGSNSPEFYADVVRSRTLADALLRARYPDPRAAAPGDSAVLLDLLEIEGEGELERLERGREELADAISVSVDRATTIVSVSVETPDPVLSAEVANRIIDRLNRFNLETRQSNARERRRFIESRLSAARRELREAEEELKRFLERNRQFRGSPELSFEHERLQRQVLIKQQVFTTLSESYEQARIQEVNDAPVITVVDHAVPPQEPSGPRPVLNAGVALLLGGVAGVLWALFREFVDRARVRDEGDYRELATRWARARAELRSLFRRRRRSEA